MDNPNVEKLVIAWLGTLSEVTTDWPVSGDKPKSLPPQFIIVDRTGGPREAMVLDRAEILVEVYCKDSRTTASDMANYIADQVQFLPAYAESITHASVNSLINLDDLVGEYSRYQLYLDVYNRR
jgi:hypothetical protein